MAEATLLGLAGTVLTQFQSLALDEFQLLWDHKEQFRKLENTITTITNVLQDAEIRKSGDFAVQGWLARLKIVLYKADDLFDKISHKILHEKANKKSKVVKEVERKNGPYPRGSSIFSKTPNCRGDFLIWAALNCHGLSFNQEKKNPLIAPLIQAMKAFKGAFNVPGDYVYFKSQVPLHKIPIGTKQWRYYDFGPKVVPPLICLPGTAGTADVYYKQIMALSMKGYRVISVDIPRVWNYQEWIQAFEKFLDALDVHHVHIYGTSLGGFLAQLFAQHRPRRVRSLILSNTFLDTHTFSAAMQWAPVVSWMPSFLLKRYVLTGIKSGPQEPFIADSVDFVVSQVETLSKDDLASRLTLTVDSTLVGPLLLSDAFITIMDTNDYCAIPQECKDEVGERYPGARRADLKTGGDFPFLSRPDEVNLHLQLHLRRAGVEPRSDLVAIAAMGYASRGITSEETEVEVDPPSDYNAPSEEEENDEEHRGSASNEGEFGYDNEDPSKNINDYDLGSSSSIPPKEDTTTESHENHSQENGESEDSVDVTVNHDLLESRNEVEVNNLVGSTPLD